jgi:hypothetical protein
MKTFLIKTFALLSWLLLGALNQSAHAVPRAVDNAAGATLLLPYFEVDLSSDNGTQTSFRLENSSATAILTNVTLWTDLGIPTQNFNVYLVGYDSVTVDLRLLFKHGIIPVTASAGQDPTNTISPRGPLSQDINFASCNAILPPAPLAAANLAGLRAAHTGQASSLFANQCGAAPRSDNIARGYITVDLINSCTLLNPRSAGYENIITTQSVLLGSYTMLNRSTRRESGGPMVAVESFFSTSGTTPPFVAGDRTFYGSYNGLTAVDQREPLGSLWAARFVNGGALGATTEITVWRDPGSSTMPFVCGGALPAPFPLAATSVAAFDEQEQVTLTAAVNQFPLATQRVPTSTLSSNTAGFLYLNLNLPAGPGATQSWVQVEQVVGGRYSTSNAASIITSTHELRGCTAPCGIALLP